MKSEFSAELKCPHCDGTFLHHEKIEIFERKEDSKTGLHITVNKGEVKADTSLSGNPSQRRNSLLIYFTCENCSETSTLSLIQHKGNTHMKFNVEDDNK